MNIDYTKPLIDVGGSEECPERHVRFCSLCGQRYVLYANDSGLFSIYMTIYRNQIQCPSCGAYGTSTPLLALYERGDFVKEN